MMSPEAAAAVYSALAGGVLAALCVLAGMFAGRYLRERGKVRCVVWGWEMTEAGALGQAVCSFEVDLFNERPSPTGLRGVSVEFFRNGERLAASPLRISVSDEELGVLNLPSRRWVHTSLYTLFEGEEARRLTGFRRAEFVGYFPDGRAFRRKIVERKDFVVGHKKKTIKRKDYALALWRRLFGRGDQGMPR